MNGLVFNAAITRSPTMKEILDLGNAGWIQRLNI